MLAAVASVGTSLIRTSGRASTNPKIGRDRQTQVAQPVNPYARLGVRLVKEPEVTKPPHAKPGVPARLLGQFPHGAPEENSRPLRLTHRPQEPEVALRQRNVVDISGFMAPPRSCGSATKVRRRRFRRQVPAPPTV